MKAYVSVTNDLSTDNRVNKICAFLIKNGHEVTLVGRKRKDSQELKREYKTKRFLLLFNTGPLFYAEYNFRLFLYLLVRRADVLVSNDLDTLLANYAATKFKANVKLFYDSHEYFTESAELVGRDRVRSFWLGIEAWILPKLKYVYTVNESIAEVYKKKYKIPVSVVRNIPSLWKPEKIASKKELSIPEDKTILIIQGAGININRGAEEALMAMKKLDSCCLLVVGAGDVVSKLKQMRIEEGLQDRVLFFDKMPYQKLMQYTYHADLGLALDKPICLNYKLALPNKVFDYLHAGTPILCTKLDEIEKLVLRYNIGFVIDELTINALSEKINTILSKPEKLEEMKENCKHAAVTENWEKELLSLNNIYKSDG